MTIEEKARAFDQLRSALIRNHQIAKLELENDQSDFRQGYYSAIADESKWQLEMYCKVSPTELN